MSRPATERLAMVGLGGSLAQTSRSLAAMEFAVRALRGWAVPYVIPVASAYRVFDAEGRITRFGVSWRTRRERS
jgi:hypothetical protein